MPTKAKGARTKATGSSIKQEVESVLTMLKGLSDSRTREEMATRYGSVTDNASGVRVNGMQNAAKYLGRKHALALERDLQMITHACGLTHPGQLDRGHLVMNISPGVRKSLADLFPYPTRQERRANAGLRSGRESSGSLDGALQIESLVSQ